MNILSYLVSKIYFSLGLPQGYTFENSRILKDGVALSSEKCIDSGLLEYRSSHDGNSRRAVISQCNGTWLVFTAAREKLPFTQEYFTNAVVQPFDSGLLVFVKNDKDAVYWLSDAPKKIEKYLFLGEGQQKVVFNFNDTSYFLQKRAAENSIIGIPEKWPAWIEHINDFTIFDKGQALVVSYQQDNRKQYGIYDSKSSEWLNHPGVLKHYSFLLEERKENVIIDLTYPEKNEKIRQYYRIYQGDQELLQTDFSLQGEKLQVLFNMKPGRVLLRAELFTSVESRPYTRAKNIDQPRDVWVDIEEKDIYIVRLEKGSRNDENPVKFVLYPVKKSFAH